jgi:histidinol-phosphate/aromatic aminotransferase/cobyric acid decarboxylase-like protein
MSSRLGSQQEPVYHGGAFWEALREDFSGLDRRENVIAADVLDAWFSPSPAVIEALGGDIAWLCRTSPPIHAEGLQKKIAQVRGVSEASILVGGGSSELIFLALSRWLQPGSRTLVLDPMYGEYAHVLDKVVGCGLCRFPLWRDENFAVHVESLAMHIQAAGFDLVAIVNPNSPTGQYVPKDQMIALLEAIPPETLVWIDETYIDYVGAQESVEAFAAASPNVIVSKSMSKVYALSGLRAAYLCGPPDLIWDLRRHCPPWAVSLPAQVAGVAALGDPGYYAARYVETHQLRTQLRTELLALGFDDVLDGVANFLLAFLPDGISAQKFCGDCRSAGLYVRDASSMGRALGESAVRIAVKDSETNGRMLKIVKKALRG